MARQGGTMENIDAGFEGFPRGLPDDCVEYTISIIDATLKDLGIRQRLRAVQSSATAFTKKLLKGFIWQRDSFDLELIQENGSSILRGRTHYGDSVEDEWLVVYILREMSRKHPDVWVRIMDTDGQFLLIEAANTLPKWLNPEIADFRVWINSGRLLIIPITPKDFPERDGKPVQQKLSLEGACQIIQKDNARLLHSPLIEAEAFYRLEKYPQQIKDSLHHALVTVPRKLAYIIRQDESYVSPAIEAFYLRDPIALRPLHAEYSAIPVFPPKDLVTVSIKFTKVGYAQLKSQHFPAPPAWTKILSSQTEEAARARKDIGMKLTSGFEMLVSDPQNKDKRQVREIAMFLEDLETGQDELPTDLEMQKWPEIQDSETWLDINFETFEQELAGNRGGPPQSINNGFGDKGAQENLRKMVARFEDFLNDDTAGVDGAENLDDMDRDDSSEDTSESEAEDQSVSFDEEQFTAMMKEMMGVSVPQREDAKSIVTPARTRQERAPKLSPSTLEPFEPTPKDSLAMSEGIQSTSSRPSQPPTVVSSDSGSSSDEEAEIREAMQGMEHELRNAGALRLNPEVLSEEVCPHNKAIRNPSPRLEHRSTAGVADLGSVDEDIDIDLNLAKNMLESFKGQAGMAGPGSNLFGMMGVHMPRDEGLDGPESGEHNNP